MTRSGNTYIGSLSTRRFAMGSHTVNITLVDTSGKSYTKAISITLSGAATAGATRVTVKKAVAKQVAAPVKFR